MLILQRSHYMQAGSNKKPGKKSKKRKRKPQSVN